MDKTKKLVLTIEDQPAIADLLGFLLDATELEVKRSDNGAEGLEMIKKFKPDLVIMDIMMPTMDGWQVFDAVRQDESVQNIPIIMLSVARQDPDRRIAFRGSHLDFYMTKPFDVQSLRRLVQEILGLEIWLKSTPTSLTSSPLSGKSTQPLPPLPSLPKDSTILPTTPAPSEAPTIPAPSSPALTSEAPPAPIASESASAPSAEPAALPEPTPSPTAIPAPGSLSSASTTPASTPPATPTDTLTLPTPPTPSTPLPPALPPLSSSPPEPSSSPQVEE